MPAEEYLDRIVDPPVPNDRTSGATISLNGLLLSAETIIGAFVDTQILLSEDLLHERGKTFVEPDICPVSGSQEISVPLVSELVRHKSNRVGLWL